VTLNTSSSNEEGKVVAVPKHNAVDNGGKVPHIHNFRAKCTTWSASGFTLRKSLQYPLGKRQKQSQS